MRGDEKLNRTRAYANGWRMGDSVKSGLLARQHTKVIWQSRVA